MTPTLRLSLAGGIATLLASLSLMPVTGEDRWLPPAVVAIVLVVASGRLAERIGAPRLLVPLVQLLVAAWWVVLASAQETTLFGVLPTPDSVRALVDLHAGGFTGINDYGAPTPPDPGIMLLCLEGVAAIALAVDVLAVQLRRAPLAGVPLVSMYAVAAAVVDGGVPWPLFVLLAVGYLVLLVADGRLRVAQWGRSVTALSSRRGTSDSSTLTRSGERVGALAIAVAVALPALVPGLANGVFGRGGGGSGDGGSQTIRTTNPIVDLKRDLTQPEDVQLLTYQTDAAQPEYLRTVTLDDFDGQDWRPSDRPIPSSQRVSRGLPEVPGLEDDVPRRERSYEFRITDTYNSSWLPLPYPADSIDIEGDWRYDVASLDVVGRSEKTRGKDYDVTSLEVRPEDGQLTTSSAPREFARFLALPEQTEAQIGAVADEVTVAAGATTAFERAVALQQWFRSEFDYSLDRRAGSSTDALASFLEDRSGYCEQFAATMAIMARSLGIPARVAVGFLPGTEAEGTWTVTARDAHAWPELYFDTVGWIRFEPTPAQRTGSAPTWTLPPSDPSAGAPSVPAPGSVPADPGAERPDTLDETAVDADALALADQGVQVPWRWVVTGVAVLLALALPAVTALVGRRLRWRRASGDPTLEAEAAWDDLRDSARDAGLGWDPAATPRSAGTTIISRAGLVSTEGELVSHVVGVAERARYAPTVPELDGLREDSDHLRRTLLGGASPTRRVLARVWPASTRDVFGRIGERVADVLDWLDTAGGRVRGSLSRLVHRGGDRHE